MVVCGGECMQVPFAPIGVTLAHRFVCRRQSVVVLVAVSPPRHKRHTRPLRTTP